MNRFLIAGILVSAAVLVPFSAAAWAMQHPVLGRFVQRDPVGYVDGYSLFEYSRSSPNSGVDPMGLMTGEELVEEVSKRLKWNYTKEGDRPGAVRAASLFRGAGAPGGVGHVAAACGIVAL